MEKKKKSGFWKGVKTEFKKISWPQKNQAAKRTALVVVAVVILGIIVSLFDTGVTALIKLLMA